MDTLYISHSPFNVGNTTVCVSVWLRSCILLIALRVQQNNHLLSVEFS